MHYMTHRSNWMQKHKFGITQPGCTRMPTDPTGRKAQVWRNVSLCAFYGIRTGPTRGWKILRWCFAPRTHRSALRYPQIPLDAKTQVWCNMSRCTFYGNCIGPTRAWKIVHRCFAPRMHVIPDFSKKTKYSSHVYWGSFVPHTWT
jgi:hypothetical protein